MTAANDIVADASIEEAEAQPDPAQTNAITVEVPTTDEIPLRLDLLPGQALYIVGPNGSGKSQLIHHFAQALKSMPIVRLLAYRQNWVSNDAPEMTASGRITTEKRIQDWGQQEDAVYREGGQTGQRIQVAMARFVASERRHADDVLKAPEHQKISVEEARKKRLSPLNRLNSLLRRGTFDFDLVIADDDKVLAKKTATSEPFGFSRLSDGERNGVFMALDVLSVDKGSVVIIDEPERHLHRSIAVPLIQALLDERPDCYFVIATHEVALPVEGSGQTLILRGCSWTKERITGWDADILAADSSLPEDLKVAILGSRRRVLFVEGSPDDSLDRPLYALLLPEFTVHAKGNSKAVRAAVSGLRDTMDEHHSEAYGLIDGDDLNPDLISKLEANSVYVLPFSAVESFYYGTFGIEAVAARVAKEGQTSESASAAIDVAMRELSKEDVKADLMMRRVERRLRNKVLSEIPKREELKGVIGTVKFECPISTEEESKLYSQHLDGKKLDELVARYPVKHSSLPQAVAVALGLKNSDSYEKELRKALAEDSSMREKVRKQLGAVSAVSGT